MTTRLQHDAALRACAKIHERFPQLKAQLALGYDIGSPIHEADKDLIALNNFATGLATDREIRRAQRVMIREAV